MAGGAPKGSRIARGSSAVKRAWPVVLMAWERWQALPEADKERYRRQARQYADKGRKAVVEFSRRGGGRR
ncbi:MAG TPA: hypothetical protein VEX39_08890 [Thermoleophilaceae bacterium]|nr:hypothetical protein [Thermoleophilaceae bacterium]